VTARPELILYAGPLPPLGVMLGQSPAEAEFLELQRKPREWREHCAQALERWHERTGVARQSRT
jgi:hypothetical protein